VTTRFGALLLATALVAAACSSGGEEPASAPADSTTTSVTTTVTLAPPTTTSTTTSTTTTTVPPAPPDPHTLIVDAPIELPAPATEPCAPDDIAGIFVTADCDDPDIGEPFIDVDEIREVTNPETGEAITYRYLHGGFADSTVAFALHLPDGYRGRFHQSTYPTVGFEGVGDRSLARAFAVGAAVVSSNNGGGVIASPTLGGVRANAAAAVLAQHVIPQVYEGGADTRGYIYGVSGGAYQTMGALESTSGVWAGGVPIVPGTPNAIPSFMTVQILGLRYLQDAFPSIVDALEPGGSGDPFVGLDEQEAAILEEITSLGFPLGGWWQYESLTGGAFGIVQLAVRGIDPGFSDDFWTVDGYEGADPASPIQAFRMQFETTVASVSGREVVVADTPPVDAFGADLFVVDGPAAGTEAVVEGADGPVLRVGADLALRPGDRVVVDNSWYLALHYYHRYQVPEADQYAWDIVRDDDGDPVHPQRPSLVGPIIADIFGSLQSGEITGKTIVIAGMNDVEALPWAADWYASQVHDALGDDADEAFRLWYLENADHIPRSDRTHAIDYGGVVEQALIDLDHWVLSGIAPPAGTAHEIDELTQVRVPSTAGDRLGIQPVVQAVVSDVGCDEAADVVVRVSAGDEVSFSASMEVPPGAGAVVAAEWDFDGSGEFAVVDDDLAVGVAAGSCVAHTFDEPGTHFVTVRVTSHRGSDPDAVIGRVVNLARVRVVVE